MTEDQPPAASPPPLLRRSVSGVAWSGAAQVLGQLLHTSMRILLARLLAPADFGLVAAVMVLVELARVFADLTLAPALVQRGQLSEEHRHTAFWTNVGVDGLLSLLVLATAPLTARFYGLPALVPIQMALSASVLLGGPNWIVAGLMTREFRFRILAFRRIASILLGGGAGLFAASQGLGAWALVIDVVIRNAAASALLLAGSDFRPRLVFSRAAFLDLWRFSFPLVGARFLEFTNGNLHFVFIGRILGPATLGLFNIGYQFVLIPILYVVRSVDQVLLAGLSRLQEHRERAVFTYLSALELVAFVTLPLMTSLSLVADLLVPGLLGDRWRGAIPLVQLLSLAGAVQSLALLGDAAFQALGRPRRSLHWGLMGALATLLSLGGLPWGAPSVAAVYLAATVAFLPINFHWVAEILGVGWLVLVRSLRGVVLGTLVALSGLLATRALLPDDLARDHPLLTALAALGVAALLYLPAALVLAPRVRQVLGQIRALRTSERAG